jgi:tetratricopeptide (TPR) repeat protein
MAIEMAALFEKKGDFAKAKGIYEEVLEKDPHSTVAANNLAFWYAELEPTERNLGLAEKLIGPLLLKHKDVPHVQDTGAWVSYRKGDLEKARDLLLAVEEKAKEIPIMNYHLGKIYLQLGEKQKAEEYLSMSLEGDQEFVGKKEAERTLMALSGGG